MTTNVYDQPRLLKDLLDSIKQASGGSSQLIHQLQDPRWMIIRQSLELCQEGIMGIMHQHASEIVRGVAK